MQYIIFMLILIIPIVLSCNCAFMYIVCFVTFILYNDNSAKYLPYLDVLEYKMLTPMCKV